MKRIGKYGNRIRLDLERGRIGIDWRNGGEYLDKGRLESQGGENGSSRRGRRGSDGRRGGGSSVTFSASWCRQRLPLSIELATIGYHPSLRSSSSSTSASTSSASDLLPLRLHLPPPPTSNQTDFTFLSSQVLFPIYPFGFLVPVWYFRFMIFASQRNWDHDDKINKTKQNKKKREKDEDR